MGILIYSRTERYSSFVDFALSIRSPAKERALQHFQLRRETLCEADDLPFEEVPIVSAADGTGPGGEEEAFVDDIWVEVNYWGV